MVTPDAHYHVESIEGCGGALDGDAYVTGAVTEACTITLTFAIDTYSLTYTAGASGSIDGPTSQTNDHGADATTVTAIADEGYHFVRWSDARTDNPRRDTAGTPP